MEIQFLALNRHKKVVGLNWLMGFQPSYSDYWNSNDNTDVNKETKTCTDTLLLQNGYTVSQKWRDNIQMESTIAGSITSSLAKGYDPLYSSSPLASLIGFS
jgi:hypothetical protein